MSNPSKLIVTSFAGIDQSNETPSRFSIELPNSIADVNNVELLSASIEYTPLYPSLTPPNSLLRIYQGSSIIQNFLQTDVFEYYPDMTTFLAKINTLYATGVSPGAPQIQFNFNTVTQTIEIECLSPILITVEDNYGGAGLFRRMGFGLEGQHIDPYFTPDAYSYITITANTSWCFQHNFTTIGEKVILPNSPNIVRSTTMYVGSDTLANDCLLPRGIPITSIMAQIPITTSEYGRVINYEMSNDQERTTTFDNNISYITLNLLDDEFNPLELKQNSRISCVFGLQYKQGTVTTTRIIH
jgi:hypothetical protein